MSTITQQKIECFQQSLRRVCLKTGFYDSFSGNFIAQSEEISGFFHAKDTTQLKHKLQETLQMVSDVAEGKPGLVLYLETLGRIHQRLNVEQRHLEMWKDALLKTVKCYDDDYDSQVKAGWVVVIDMTIAFMFPEDG
jgi:hemoglobin-like flavoprotein